MPAILEKVTREIYPLYGSVQTAGRPRPVQLGLQI